MDKLKMCSIETHVADSRTAVLHPASHTHRQLNDEQLQRDTEQAAKQGSITYYAYPYGKYNKRIFNCFYKNDFT